jgi:hypothetical protein
MSDKLYAFCDAAVAFTGFLLVFGVSGAIDTAPDSQLLPLCGIALCGLALLFVGINGLTNRK